jgi:hypothetical protein
MRGLAIALFLLAAPQDDARVRTLIRELEDDGYETRDRAQKELVKLGEPALPLLRKALEEAGTAEDRGELRVRAQAAIRAIDLEVKSRKVYSDPRLVTLRASGMKLSQAVQEIAKQTGVRIDASAVDGEATLDLELRDAPLFRALDELCRGSDERTWDPREAGEVKLLKEKHVACPSAYAGPFRLRAVSLKAERSTDFKTKSSILRMTLEADHEKYLKPSRFPEIEIAKAADDKGAALEIGGEDEDSTAFAGGAAMKIFVAGMAGAAPDGSPAKKTYVLKGLSPGAARVSIQGSMRFRFPLESRDIRFEKADAGQTRETSDYTVRLDSQGGRQQWNLSFRRKKPAPGATGTLDEEVSQRLDEASLVGIDEDGGEHKGSLLSQGGRMAAIRVINGRMVQEGDAAAFIAHFPTVKLKALKEIRFRISDATFLKSVPFSLEGIELP